MQINTKDAKEIGNQLHLIRISLQMTLKDAGRSAGFTDKSLRWLERGMFQSRTTNLVKAIQFYEKQDMDEDTKMRLDHIRAKLNMEPIS